MADENGSSLDVGGLGEVSKVVRDLIAVVDRRWLEPGRIIALAKANSKADEIREISHIYLDEKKKALLGSGVARSANDIILREQNIQDITAKAIPNLKATAEPFKIDPDWMTRFISYAGEISDADMQEMWAKILSEEANAPRSFGKRAINIMSLLSYNEARDFDKICGMAFENHSPLILDSTFTKSDSNRALESAGLITISDDDRKITVDAGYEFRYFGRSIIMREEATINVGRIRFTDSGRQIRKICSAKAVEGYFEDVLRHLSSYSGYQNVWAQYNFADIPQ